MGTWLAVEAVAAILAGLVALLPAAPPVEPEECADRPSVECEHGAEGH